MLRLPARIEVRLTDLSGRALGAPQVLIGLNVLLNGRYYYGNLVGLTDDAGVARLRRDELDLRFASDRADYPMDYKVQLEDCDPLIEVVLISESEFAEASQATSSNPAVSSDIRASYAAARNSSYAPAVVRFWADLPKQQCVVVSLPTRRQD